MTKLRRLALVLVVWATWLAVTTAGAGLAADAASVVYLDRFQEVSYSGSDGSAHWTGPWKEIAEANGPSKGALRVGNHESCMSNCLLIGGNGLGMAGKGVARAADLSGAVEARLRFRVDVEVFDDANAGAVAVAVAAKGQPWTLLRTYLLSDDDDASGREQFDITGHVSAETRIGFFGLGWVDGEMIVDDVTIEANLEIPTTTTSTTTTTQPPTTTTTTTTRPPTATTTTTTTTPPTTTTTTTTTRPPTATTTTTTTTPPTTTTTTTSRPPTTTTTPPTTTTTTTTEGPGGSDSDGPPNGATGSPGNGGDTLPTEDVTDDPRYLSKEALAASSLDAASRATPRSESVTGSRSPIDVVMSSAEIARVAIETHALEAFILGTVVAWLALRGLGSRKEIELTEGGEAG